MCMYSISKYRSDSTRIGSWHIQIESLAPTAHLGEDPQDVQEEVGDVEIERDCRGDVVVGRHPGRKAKGGSKSDQ